MLASIGVAANRIVNKNLRLLTKRHMGGVCAVGRDFHLTDKRTQPSNGRFSNRPFGVKRFRTIHRCSVDVAHGLVLLFGIGTRGPSIMGFEDEVEQSNGRPCRQCNGRSKRTNELTSSIVPQGTSFHRRVELECSPIAILRGPYAAAASSRVQRNSVPSTHMRCMITANRRASATIAFFFPRRLAICIAQALSQDHLLVWVSMTWAAS